MTVIQESALLFLYPQDRTIFFNIYLLLYTISFFGNTAAIIVTLRRNQRSLQKSCIVSLALSDLITATSLLLLGMNTFCQRLLVWKLGSFLCSFLPTLPIFGVICSSVALVGIALDRYHSVVLALRKRWHPSVLVCFIIVLTIWTAAAGLSYPMYTVYVHVYLNVSFTDHTNMGALYYETHAMCITFRKNILFVYYVTIISVIFVPLLLLFFWLYYRIAHLIWDHRKPLSVHINKNETSNVAEASTTQTRISEDGSKVTHSDSILSSVAKKKNMHLERKIRTFKIIVSLMCIFLILRLPVWVFDVIKLSVIMDGHAAWIVKHIATSLTLLSCSLNPFLYTFLNKTIDVCTQFVRAINEFICQVCCCCFSGTEFQEFENENPFNKTLALELNKNDSGAKKSRVDSVELPDVIMFKESCKENKKY